MGNIDVCTEFELLEVKVLIVFLGTVGFLVTRGWTVGSYIHANGSLTRRCLRIHT